MVRKRRKLGSIGSWAGAGDERAGRAIERGEASVLNCLICGSKDTIDLYLKRNVYVIPKSGPLQGFYVTFSLCQTHEETKEAEIQRAFKQIDMNKVDYVQDKNQGGVTYKLARASVRERVSLVEAKARNLRKQFPHATIEEAATWLVTDTEPKDFVRACLQLLQDAWGWPSPDGEGWA